MLRVFRSLFDGIIFLQVRTVSLIMFLLVLPLPSALFACRSLHTFIHPFLTFSQKNLVCSLFPPLRLLSFSPAVELNLGRFSGDRLNDAQVSSAPHKQAWAILAGWEPVSVWLVGCCFIILRSSSPSQFMCSAHTPKIWLEFCSLFSCSHLWKKTPKKHSF